MALSKATKTESGISYNYHRIISLELYTNVQCVINTRSYLSKADRIEEQKLIDNPQEDKWFMKATTGSSYVVDYDENMSIPKAYEYLKTLDEFKNSKDVLENGQEVVSD